MFPANRYPQSVPGCTGTGVARKGYCFSLNAILPVPNSQPTRNPATANVSTPGKEVTYVPGLLLTVVKAGLRLSAGLDLRIIANKDRPVKYDNGGQSSMITAASPRSTSTLTQMPLLSCQRTMAPEIITVSRILRAMLLVGSDQSSSLPKVTYLSELPTRQIHSFCNKSRHFQRDVLERHSQILAR
jgi:hypothetical protein